MRKSIQFILLMVFTSSLYSCTYAQDADSEKQIIEMLKVFYTEYNTLWSIKPPLKYETFEHKLDSLYEKYCTPQLRTEAKKYLRNGHDLLTKDLGSVDLNENLRIDKDLKIENGFIVTFYASNSDAIGNPVKQKVEIHITVIKEGGNYKIKEVK
jgi:hypothetical protein